MNYLKIAKYVAEKHFHYNKNDVVEFGEGGNGTAFLVDNGRKILKLTIDDEEALRANRLKGKSVPHLIGYYDVLRIKLNGSYLYCLLMDRLYNLIKDDSVEATIFSILYTKLQLYSEDKIPGEDLDKSKLKKYIDQNFNILYFMGADKQGLIPHSKIGSDPIKIDITKKMWFDIIQIRKQMRKYHIFSCDMHSNNLGYKDGVLTFFDMGSYGKGGKELKNKKNIHIDDRTNLEKIGSKVMSKIKRFIDF